MPLRPSPPPLCPFRIEVTIMHCEQAEMLLVPLVFDEVDPAAQGELLAHVDGCSACGEKLGDLRVTAGLVREGVEVESATGPVLSTERRASLLTRVASSPRRRFGLSPAARKTLRTLLRPRALGVAAGFAVVVVGLAGLFWPEIAREGGGRRSPVLGCRPAGLRSSAGGRGRVARAFDSGQRSSGQTC